MVTLFTCNYPGGNPYMEVQDNTLEQTVYVHDCQGKLISLLKYQNKVIKRIYHYLSKTHEDIRCISWHTNGSVEEITYISGVFSRLDFHSNGVLRYLSYSLSGKQIVSNSPTLHVISWYESAIPRYMAYVHRPNIKELISIWKTFEWYDTGKGHPSAFAR